MGTLAGNHTAGRRRTATAGRSRSPGRGRLIRQVVPVRPVRVVAAVALMAMCLLGIPVATADPAGAHAELVASDPAHGEVVAEAPDEITLQFSERVQPPSDAVTLLDDGGDEVEVGEPQVAGTDLAVALPDLEQGAYVVSWHVVSADSHPIGGAFLFYVGAAAGDGGDAEALLADVLADSGADTSLGIGYGVARFLLFVGLTLLVGVPLFLVLVWPEGAGRSRVRRLMAVGWGLTLAATLAGFGFQAAYGVGGSWADALDGDRLGDVLGSRAGQAWLVRIGLLAAVAVWWQWSARLRITRFPALVWGAGAALMATVSFAGHAATGRWVAAALVADVGHLLAAGFWLAGLTVMFVAVLRDGEWTGDEGHEADDTDDRVSGSAHGVAARFSSTALAAVAVLAGTGLFQGWRQVGEVSALTGTTYGRLLLAKVAVVVLVLAAATASRRVVQRWRERSPGALRRSVGVEAVGAVVVLAVTAVLVATVPGREAGAEGSWEGEVHGSALAVQVEVDPAEAGPVDVSLHTVTHGSEPLEVEEVSAEVSSDEHDITRLPLEVEPADGVGAYRSVGADLPFSGVWQMEVVVRLSEYDVERLTVEIPVD